MNKLARGTKSSIRIKNCQVCDSDDLEEVISLGFIPQVNILSSINDDLKEEVFFPHELLKCKKCSLVQLSHIVDPEIVFPKDYSYTTRTTKALQDNFKDLSEKVEQFISLKKDDLVIDIGGNDGTNLNYFKPKCRVLNVEPTDNAKYANEHGITSIQEFFTEQVVKEKILPEFGKANLITCSNCFAHIEDIHSIIEAIKLTLKDDGIFINENHYLMTLMQTNQWDTIYTEHLRYFSLISLKYLFDMHNLEIFNVEQTLIHGGSIRVYTAQKGKYKIQPSVEKLLKEEEFIFTQENFDFFKRNIIKSKLDIYSLIKKIKNKNKTIGCIGAPSRGITYLNYVGLNEDIIKFIAEASGSNKINKFAAGTKIPIVEETIELLNSVDYLLLLSWHIKDELIPKLKAKGYKGQFIVPLPLPTIIE